MSEAHYNDLLATVGDYLYKLGELESKLSELDGLLREARDKGAPPISLDFGELPDFGHLTYEADVMSGWVYSVLHPEP